MGVQLRSIRATSWSSLIHPAILWSGHPVTWIRPEIAVSGEPSYPPSNLPAINGLKIVLLPVAISRISLPVQTFFVSSGIIAAFSDQIISQNSSKVFPSRPRPSSPSIRSLMTVIPFALGQMMPSSVGIS
ncbi:MAG: hypothetical protein Q8O99_01760 [bacterium]|nr:hypothetical protein [bacterium]